jgi:hypothetical protein
MSQRDRVQSETRCATIPFGTRRASATLGKLTFNASTLATDLAFKSRVSEIMLIRLLDAFVWRHHNPPEDALEFTYVQGMNVLAAPFLYIMPTELEAFYSFAAFIELSCPLYVQPTLEGVHRGLKVCTHGNGFPVLTGFLAFGSLSQSPRSGSIYIPSIQESHGRNLCIPLCVAEYANDLQAHLSNSRAHVLRLHATTRSGLTTMGFSFSFRYPPQCPLCYCTAAVDERRSDGFQKVVHVM